MALFIAEIVILAQTKKMEQEAEENQLIDIEHYKSQNEGMGFKEICMRQLQRVVSNMSREMRAGFWVYSHPAPMQVGTRVRYVGDSRKELKQSVDVLHDLLMPKFDEEIKRQSEDIYKEFDEWHGTFKGKEATQTRESEYWDKALKIYRTLFQQLCLFLERIGWLETVEAEE